MSQPDRGPLPSLVDRTWAKFRARFDDRTNRQLAVVFAGHGLRLGLGLISSAILARGLGPEGLSVFSVVGAASMIGATVADFGLSNSGVRHIADDLTHSRERAQRTASVYTRLKLLGTLLVFVLIFIGARPLADLLDVPPDSGPLLVRLGALGLLAGGLGGSFSTLLRALRRFGALVLTQTANILLTILLLGVLLLAAALDVPAALSVGAVAAFVAAVVGFLLLPGRWRRALLFPPGPPGESARRLLSFGKWLWVSAVLSILLSQLDLLMLNHTAPPRTAGFYALALNLAFKADIVNQTLHTVLLPAVSALDSAAAHRRYVRRSLVRSGLLAVVIIVLAPLAGPLILIVYGPAYRPSIGVFYALLGVVLFDLLTTPILLLAFPMDVPRAIAASDVVRVLTLFLLGSWLIPAFGMYGAAVAKLAAKVAGALVLGSVILQRLRDGGM